MVPVFKAAMNHIHADENLKAKTKEYLIKSLAASSGEDPAGTRNPFLKRALVTACAVLCVCAVSVGAFDYYRTPTSYLSLDISSGVELGVNTFGKVVSAVAYDSEGKTVLDGQNVINTDVTSAVHALVGAAAQKGDVAKDGSTVIAITTETDNGATASALENAAAQGADSAIKSEGRTATVQKDHVSLEKREEAQEFDITPGKLNLIQKLQALDPSVTVSEYKDSEVSDIMKKYTELKEDAGNDNAGSSENDENSQDTPDGTADADSGNTPEEGQKVASGDEGNSESPSGESSQAGSGKSSSSRRSGSSEAARNHNQNSSSGRSASSTTSRPSTGDTSTSADE